MIFILFLLLTGCANKVTAPTPSPPPKLVVNKPYEVILNWQAPQSSADPVVKYAIWREELPSITYTQLSLVTTTTSTDVTVVSGKSYNYYVTSVDAVGNQSGPSNTYSVVIPILGCSYNNPTPC
jgi:fibronectin type 3 domain-containing protein